MLAASFDAGVARLSVACPVDWAAGMKCWHFVRENKNGVFDAPNASSSIRQSKIMKISRLEVLAVMVAFCFILALYMALRENRQRAYAASA